MWQFNTTLAFVLGTFGYFSNDIQEPKQLVVNTTYGLLKGTTSLSRNERTIYEFLGIPYAKPPVGSLRFQPPSAPDSWDGIRDATEAGSQCLQIHLLSRIIFGDENCLSLNVYTHQFAGENSTIEVQDLKPVIFYIHGGFFMHGSSKYYRPKYFLDEDVVLVTTNYRVGALGFLNMGTSEIQGNMGLKDQVMALTYVRDNIRQFGGDPNRVTIMGESAGAVCVHTHLLSKMSKGLFNGAITQSGTALNFWAIKENAKEQAKRFANIVGCGRDTVNETTECLLNMTGIDIVKGHREAVFVLAHSTAIFGPTVENVTEVTQDVFLHDTPLNIIKSGEIARVPWMNGVNSEEGLVYAPSLLKNSTVRREINKNWTKWIPILFNFHEEPQKEFIANKIREFYFGDVSTEISMKTLTNLTNFLSDRTFFQGFHNTALLHGQNSNSPMYLFLYAYQGSFSFANVGFQMTYMVPTIADVALTSGWGWVKKNVFKMKQQNYGVCHGDELPLLFNLPMQPIHKAKSTFGKDYEMSEYLIRELVSFATNGKPSDESWLPAPVNVSWNSTDETIQMMKIDKVDRGMIDEPYALRAHFWETLNLKPYKIDNVNCTETPTYIQCVNEDTYNFVNSTIS